MKIPNGLSVWVGLPGAGKTSCLAYCVQKYIRKNPEKNAFSNVPIIGAKKYSHLDFGHKKLENGLLGFDEAGIEEYGRNFKKNMSDNEKLEFLKKFRHHDIFHFLVFSQAMDFDKVYADLASSLHIMRKLGPWTLVFHYKKALTGFDAQTGKPIFGWKLQFFPWERVSIIFRPPTYKYFDSYEKMSLDAGEFEEWTQTSRFKIYSPDYVPPHLRKSRGILALEHTPINNYHAAVKCYA